MNSKKLLLSLIVGSAFLVLLPIKKDALALNCPFGVVPISQCNQKYGTSHPEYVCCRQGNEDINCPGPWTAIDYVCCAKDIDMVIIELVEVFGCYSTDVCDPPEPGHQNERIKSGLCGSDGGYGVQCTIGGWYKSCCIDDQGTKGICGIDYPYDASCDSGSVIRYDDPNVDFQTCLAKGCSCSAWQNGSCGGNGCASNQRHQTRDCNPDGCDIESHCVSDPSCNPGCNCTGWVNGACGGGGCPANQRYQTRTCNPTGCAPETQCVGDPSCSGNGGCSTTCGIPCCEGAWWNGGGLNCGRCGCPWDHSAQCVGGTWVCHWNPSLCGVPATHLECSGCSCVEVDGEAADQCSSSGDCQHTECEEPPSTTAQCVFVCGQTSDECAFDEQCQPAECGYTAINGGAEYTNNRSVTLTTDAENASEMRFRNESFGWSSWETYASSKNWTLSSGADGQRRVTAQYDGPKGTSDPTNPVCSDTIILDTAPPQSSMTALPAWSTTNPVSLDWSGSDNMAPAGELTYWLQYNIDGGDWIDLESSQSNPTDETSYFFTGTEGTLYCFRVRAVDPAGNWEDWPVPYDTCTSIDVTFDMYGFGYEFGVVQPDAWVSVYDGVSGINYSAARCWYSTDGGSNWIARTCYCGASTCASYTGSADPITISMSNVPFSIQSATQNRVRFRACDIAGNCIANSYTVDNRTTGPWVQTYGGDIHGNSNIYLKEAP
jgi:hypothetical protein